VSRAGISREQGRIIWHDLRHTYGSHLAMRGVPLKVIQELMGHATIEDCWALNGEEYGT
jgi:site-specific recombinase XerD